MGELNLHIHGALVEDPSSKTFDDALARLNVLNTSRRIPEASVADAAFAYARRQPLTVSAGEAARFSIPTLPPFWRRRSERVRVQR